MAKIFHSDMARGLQAATLAFTKGVVVVHQSTYVLPKGAAVTAGDILELGILPAGTTLLGAGIAFDKFDGTSQKADVGLMSGAVGSSDTTRTCGAELFDDEAIDSAGSAATTTYIDVAPANVDRSIGAKIAVTVASVTVDTAITLRLYYALA